MYFGLWLPGPPGRLLERPRRATNFPYTVYHKNGSDTVEMNQKVDGRQWNLLGSYEFDAGDYSVVLIDGVSGIVIADAVKWELVP